MNANSNLYTPQPTPTKRRNNLVIGLFVGILLILCCCIVVAAGVVVFADPFNLNIKARLFGGTFDAAAEAMPVDTGFYAGVNILAVTPDQIDRVIQPFAEALDIDQKSWNEIILKLDETFSEAMDITLTDDVKPWIGQYVGIGVTNIRINDDENPVDLIIAIESRNNKAADDFISKLRDGIEVNSDEKFEETNYQNVTIYTIPPADGIGLSFCRSGSLVLFSFEETVIHTAIDAQKGKSLVDNNRYEDMIKKMPGKRIATLYFNSQDAKKLIDEVQSQAGGVFDQITGELGGEVPLPPPEITDINLDMYDSILLSFSIADAGIQFDLVTSYNMENISSAQRELLESMSKSSKAVDMFPDDTLLFLTSQRLDLSYDLTIETLRDLSQDASDSIDNALQSVREATDIDLEEDLFHQLDGEFALGIFPSSQGILAQQASIDLGFALLAESSDTGALANTMDSFTFMLEEEGAGVERFESGDLSLYEILENPDGEIVFAGGIKANYLSLASSSQVIEDLFAGKPPLSDNPRYLDAISSLPDGVIPMLFLDVEGTIGIIRESLSVNSRDDFDQSIKVLNPIPYVVLGCSKFEDNIMQTTLLIHVK